MRGEKIVHGDAEDLRHLGKHIGVRDGLAPLPLGDGLIRIIQFFTQLRLGQAGLGAQFDDVAGRNEFQFR